MIRLTFHSSRPATQAAEFKRLTTILFSLITLDHVQANVVNR